ncbi:cysteinyl-tRNA synthetase [Ceratobasidium sp. 428]|nr:cysteinyl-tRNA synthetase [Ceratobasidium sp. 428]
MNGTGRGRGQSNSVATPGPAPGQVESSRAAAETRPLSLALTLQRLLLADNQLLDDVFHPLAVLRDLRVLNLSFNQISEVPAWRLQTFTQLEELYLSGNRLRKFPPENLVQLPRLTVLFLNANRLRRLPAELLRLNKLASLDVRGRVMASTPHDGNLYVNRDVRHLNLSGIKRVVVRSSSLDPDKAGSTPAQPGEQEGRQTDIAILRDIRVLGLIDETNLVPSSPDESDNRHMLASSSDVDGVSYGISDTLGKLEQLNMFGLAIPRFRGNKHEYLFGIFMRIAPAPDSSRLARYLHENVGQALEVALKGLQPDRGENIPDALRRAFLSLNKTLYDYLLPSVASTRKMIQALTIAGNKELDPSSLKASASACVAYLVERTLHVANVGSSLAIISRNGAPFDLFRKHDPFARSEATRIQKAGGWVSATGLVNDEPNCDESRAFGVYHLFPVVNARPDVETWELTDQDEFVIIGNRGFWEHMDSQTAVDIVRASRARREEPTVSAQILRDHAISYGAEGNTMIMVISVSEKYVSATVEPEAEFQAMLALRRFAQSSVYDMVSHPNPDQPNPKVPPPIGQIALVFTSILDSATLWDRNTGMSRALQIHNCLLRRELRECGGYEVKTEGNAFMVSFQSALAALLWCLKVQIGLCGAAWPSEILASEECKEKTLEGGVVLARGLSVRMGIHWGAPFCEEDPNTGRMDYFGPVVNRAARISSAAMGGEIVIGADALKEIKSWIQYTSLHSGGVDEESGFMQVFNELKELAPVTCKVGERELKGFQAPEILSSVAPETLGGRLAFLRPDCARANLF